MRSTEAGRLQLRLAVQFMRLGKSAEPGHFRFREVAGDCPPQVLGKGKLRSPCPGLDPDGSRADNGGPQ